MVYSNYNERRKVLAETCADAIGLKELPVELRSFAIQCSDLPLNIINDGEANSYPENSLLSLGVVYCYGSTLNFIARDGHTCILPNNDIIKEELRKCGYVICKEGSASPIFGSDLLEDSLSEDYLYYKGLEDDFRERITLPKEFLDEVVYSDHEVLGQENFEEDSKYLYNVFSLNLYKGHDFSNYELMDIGAFLGYENLVTRKLLAFSGAYAERSLSRPYVNVTDLKSFLKYAQDNEILNDDMYFSEGGFFKIFTGSKTKK